MLIDLPLITDGVQIKAVWVLLKTLYNFATFLSDFSQDERRRQVAHLIIAAWDACVAKGHLDNQTKLTFVAGLESCGIFWTVASQRLIGSIGNETTTKVENFGLGCY